MDAAVLYVVRFWVDPQGHREVFDWLDGGHCAEVASQPGFRFYHRLALEQPGEDIGHITAAPAQAMQASLGSLLFVRNVQVSTMPLPVGNQSLCTLIQNSLSDQTIQNLVTVNLATNSLALLRSFNASDQLRGLALGGGH